MGRLFTYKNFRPFIHIGVWVFLSWGLVPLIRKTGPVWCWFFVINEALLIAAVYFNFYVLVPRYFSADRYLRYLGVLLLEWLGVIALQTLLVWFFYHWPKPFAQDDGGMYPTAYFNFTVKFFLLALAKIGKELYLKAQRGRQYKLEKLQAELLLLRNQLSPHFLFNTLNNIYALVTTRSDKAGDSVLLLSNLLHYLLYESNAEKVPVRSELEFIRTYIDLERLRLDETQPVHLEIKGSEQGLVAPTILFNFIENAFKHGSGQPFDKNGTPCFIDILLELSAHSLAMKVTNSRQDRTVQRHNGIGIENARRRLDLIYGAHYTLDIQSPPGLFIVLLKIPLL